ncbi:hypothetical protein AAMO2058_001594100 [Amorphochlora amoebiformis]
MYSLQLVVLDGSDLHACDSNGLSDPYVSIRIQQGKKTRKYKTEIKYKTLNPQWNQSFCIPLSSLQARVWFKVQDYDRWSSNDEIGRADFDLKSLDVLGAAKLFALKLTNSKLGDKGILNVRASVISNEKSIEQGPNDNTIKQPEKHLGVETLGGGVPAKFPIRFPVVNKPLDAKLDTKLDAKVDVKVDGKVDANAKVDGKISVDSMIIPKGQTGFVFVDGVLSEKLSRTSDELPEGVYVGGMENIPDEIKDQVLKEASKVPADMYGSEYWAALNKYMMRDIAVIYVPEDTVVKDPIQISFYTTPSDDPTLASASFPRLVIISGKNSDAQALVYHTGAHNAIYHSSPSTTVNLAEGSTFNMYYHQEQSEEAIHTEVINATLADKSTFIWTGLAEGGTVGRLNMDVDVIGDDANVELWGASLAPKGAEQDLHTAVLHYGNSGHSVQEQRTIVGKKGHGVFRGQMKILSESFYTEVDQQSKALLLSPDGEVDAMPTLVVSPDKVEGAAHGSTVSDLGGEEMFYMMCRGVSESDAKAMLTKGFIRHIVGRFPFSFLRARNIEKILRMAERASVQWRFTEIDKTEGLDTMERDEEMAQFM